MPINRRRWALGIAVLALLACRPGTGPGGVRTPAGTKQGNGAGGVTAGGASSGTPSAAPTPALTSDVAAIPLSAHIVRDLRHVPLDFAYAATGTWWLLDAKGLWKRTDLAGWLQVADFTGTDLAQPADSPVPELVVDGQDRPWLLDRKLGHLWRLGAANKWEAVAADLPGAKGLSVGADGTAYALVSGTTSYYRIRPTGVETIAGKPWKAPAATGVGSDGKVFVVDPGSNSVVKPETGQVLAPVPSGMGAISMGRDADGSPLIVGGIRAPVVIRVGEKALTFPKMPTAVFPTAGEVSGMRLFVKEPGRVVLMTRVGAGSETTGELREGYAPERKPGPSATASTAYTGKPLQLRSLIERKAAELGRGYQLYRISGRNMDEKGLNGQSAWLYEFVGQAGEPLLAISLGPQGLVVEQVYLNQQPAGLTPIGTLSFDVDQAWAYAIKAGMTRNVRFDVSLETIDGKPVWRLNWVNGGQTYRVDAVSGNAALEGSAAAR